MGPPVSVRWATTAVPEAAAVLLTGAERARWASLRFPEDRARLLAAHALGRLLVAERLAIRPADVELRQTCGRCGGPHGRPIAHVSGAQAPHLSLAHAGGLVVAAVGATDVGIDVEPLAQTAAALAAIEEVARGAGDRAAPDELVRWWVAKEALAKARGTGWDAPVGSLRIGRLGRADGHRVRPVELVASYVGAVAVRGRQRPVVDVAGIDWGDLTEAGAPSPRATG